MDSIFRSIKIFDICLNTRNIFSYYNSLMSCDPIYAYHSNNIQKPMNHRL